MFYRIMLLVATILGIYGIFYLADQLGLPVLWVIGFAAVSTSIRYGSLILIGGNSTRILSYFKRRPLVRFELVNDILARKQTKSDGLRTEELVALLIISMVKESIDVAHARASEFPDEVFGDEFFGYLLQTLHDTRAIGLSREFQLQLIGFGENLAKSHQLSEWASEFHKQRELIFKRHAESIPVIRAPR